MADVLDRADDDVVVAAVIHSVNGAIDPDGAPAKDRVSQRRRRPMPMREFVFTTTAERRGYTLLLLSKDVDGEGAARLNMGPRARRLHDREQHQRRVQAQR